MRFFEINNRKKINRSLLYSVILNVWLPLIIGALIYILFRKDSLTVFKWLDTVYLSSLVEEIRSVVYPFKYLLPEYLLYSLPDGIWVYSGTFLFLTIWNDTDHKFNRIFWILMPLICSCSAELLQLYGVIQGTYCPFDMSAYFLSFLLSITVAVNSVGGWVNVR